MQVPIHLIVSGALLLAVLSLVGAEPEAAPQEDVADVPALELTLDDDPHKRFFLIGEAVRASDDGEVTARPEAPRDGYRLVVVLPGGTGSADFHPFVKRIWKNALDEDTVVAQLVAPVWSEQQAQNHVWPSKGNPHGGMEFSTEEFVDEVIEHVFGRLPIDPAHVVTFAWSSSGPATYSYALRKDRLVTGSFVAMSVFKPNELPNPKVAKGHAFYVMHPEEDFIPMTHAENAVEVLGKEGATTKLAKVPGEHGWTGDVYGNVRAGFEWLALNAEEPGKRARKLAKKGAKAR